MFPENAPEGFIFRTDKRKLVDFRVVNDENLCKQLATINATKNIRNHWPGIPGLNQAKRASACLLIGAAFFGAEHYILQQAFLLDPSSTIHIWNHRSRFQNFPWAPAEDYIQAGDSKVRVIDYGEVDLQLTRRGEKHTLRLFDAAYCKGFACSVVSPRVLQKELMWWDTKLSCIRIRDQKSLPKSPIDVTSSFSKTPEISQALRMPRSQEFEPQARTLHTLNSGIIALATPACKSLRC